MVALTEKTVLWVSLVALLCLGGCKRDGGSASPGPGATGSDQAAGLARAGEVLEMGAKASVSDLRWVVAQAAAHKDDHRWREAANKARRRLAERAKAGGDLLEAVRQYTVLGRDWPDCATCPALAAGAASRMKYSDPAASAFEALAKAWKGSVEVNESFARWLADNGKKDRAVQVYKRILLMPVAKSDFMLQARINVALSLLKPAKAGEGQ